MKIGFVLDDGLDSNDGVQQYVRVLGTWLSQQGHEVNYLVGESKKLSKDIYSLSKNIKMKFNGNRLTIPVYASSRLIRDLLNREQYDILHVQMPYSPAMAAKIIKYASPHTAVIGTFHILPLGRPQTAANYMLAKLLRPTLGRFNAMCSVSDSAQKFAARTYGLDSTVIPNMIDVAQWQTTVVPVSRKIVFLGRLVARKGCQQLLQVLHALPPAQRQSLQIVIAGAGPRQVSLEKLAGKFGLNAVFLGYVAESDKPALLASADYAVFPSTGGESFGIVLLEAMAAGSGVVIGGDNPGYRSVLDPFPGCLIDFTSTRAAAAALSKLMNDTQAKRKLHDQQKQAIKNYDVNIVGQKIIEMYTKALTLTVANSSFTRTVL